MWHLISAICHRHPRRQFYIEGKKLNSGQKHHAASDQKEFRKHDITVSGEACNTSGSDAWLLRWWLSDRWMNMFTFGALLIEALKSLASNYRIPTYLCQRHIQTHSSAAGQVQQGAHYWYCSAHRFRGAICLTRAKGQINIHEDENAFLQRTYRTYFCGHTSAPADRVQFPPPRSSSATLPEIRAAVSSCRREAVKGIKWEASVSSCFEDVFHHPAAGMRKGLECLCGWSYLCRRSPLQRTPSRSGWSGWCRWSSAIRLRTCAEAEAGSAGRRGREGRGPASAPARRPCWCRWQRSWAGRGTRRSGWCTASLLCRRPLTRRTRRRLRRGRNGGREWI